MTETVQIFYTILQLHHSQLRLLIFLFVASAINVLILPVVVANPHKYTNGALVSALSGHSLNTVDDAIDLGGNADAAAGGGGSGGVVNAVNSAAAAAAVAAAASLDGSASNGGEVLVPKTFPMSPQEPTCEQLRAMWIFSKRQSRAAEITNEIPTYRDPFTYNIWEPYYSTTRSMGSYRVLPRYGERLRSPVFGRVVSREPMLPQHISAGHRQRHFNSDGNNSGSRMFGAEYKSTYPAMNSNGSRRPSQFRFIGSNGSTVNGAASSNHNSVAVQGSFQKLKELIWTERAKELTQQRRAEELAARAAVLKEIANGQNILSNYKLPFKPESSLMDVNRSPNQDASYQHDAHISFANGQSYLKNSKNYYNNLKIYNTKHDKGTNINKGNNKNDEVGAFPASLVGSSRRSFGSSSSNNNNIGHQMPNLGHSDQIMLPDVISSSDRNDEVGHKREREHDYGIPNTLRPSHFRERNRSLFKQRTSDFFQRNIRHDTKMLKKIHNQEISSFERLLSNLLQRRMNPQNKGRNEIYYNGLINMFNGRRRLLTAENPPSSESFLSEVDNFDSKDENILNYMDPLTALTTYQWSNKNKLIADEPDNLYDYNNHY